MDPLDPRPGVLGRRLAFHLLSRTTYNITPARIDFFATQTAQQAVTLLFDPNGSPPLWPDGPLDHYGNKIFSDIEYRHEPGLSYSGTDRRRAIHTWRTYEAMNAPTAKWKLVHYLASIFTIYETGFIFTFHYWRLLERLAFSDLKTFATKITYDHQMLRYLNNNVNEESAPNENYAREFLELFTIRRGQQDNNDPSNYTTYTEQDISIAARVLTGIQSTIPNPNSSNFTNPTHPNFPSTVGLIDPDTNLLRGYNRVSRHDKNDKTFTQAFGGRTITGATSASGMDNEVAEFVDMVFDQIETAQSYVRKMYYFFVNDVISTEVENDIIVPLADKLILNGYDYILVLKELLESYHFYDEDDAQNDDETISMKVKSPYELLMTTKNLIGAASLRDPNNINYYSQIFKNDYNKICVYHLEHTGLDPRGPDTVEGYSGWNDEDRSRNWFTSNFLYNRHTFGISFRRGKVREHATKIFPFQTDMVAWVAQNIDVAGGPGTISAPIGAADADLLVTKMLGYLIIELPTGDRLDYFKNKLLGGLSPINWYFSWNGYLTSGDDAEVKIGIERLYDSILSSPEFQTF